MAYEIKVSFVVKGPRSFASARSIGEAIFEHVYETFNDDGTIKKNGFVECIKVTK